MTKGVQCDFTLLDKDVRMADMEEAINRENHKSAIDKIDLLESLVEDNIKAGFQVPVPIDLVHKIKNGVVAPYGIAYQFSINEQGERVDKDRLTHDQSFDFSKENSVNNRLIQEDLSMEHICYR